MKLIWNIAIASIAALAFTACDDEIKEEYKVGGGVTVSTLVQPFSTRKSCIR